jgi:hypothetical protein
MTDNFLFHCSFPVSPTPIYHLWRHDDLLWLFMAPPRDLNSWLVPGSLF